MMLPNEKTFWPSLLTPAALKELISEIRAANSDAIILAGTLRRLAQTAIDRSEPETAIDELRLAVAASVLADLAEQGWSVCAYQRWAGIQPPDTFTSEGETIAKVKTRIRNGLLMSSDRQLATRPVQNFIRFMERERAYKGNVVSVKTLVDDGEELAAKLDGIETLNPSERVAGLRRLIRPVIQVCDPSAVCKFTGLKLQDIWRYFRHTWSLEYNPLPGRTLRLLIRNRARKNWPIMGITMLASPAANLYVRDEWIGWRIDDLVTHILEKTWDAGRVSKVLLETVRQAISDIRTDDLVKPKEIENPTGAVFFRLQQIAARAEASRRHDLRLRGQEDARKVVDIRCFDKEQITERGWRKLSRTSLYIRKRAQQLELLLRTLRYFKDADFETAPAAALYEALVSKRGREAVTVALNEIRKRKLATEVADVSVCGAIMPYNHLLGGKLVALLMASVEVRQAYAKRYSKQPSEIASQIAGRPIKRSADLKVLTTTSLYGVGSSQYNRLRLPKGIVPRFWHPLVWEELSPTQGISVTHLSKLTVAYMRQLGAAVYGTRRINSVFGEGSSPRTRQVREGLNLIGINNDDVLKHSVGRRVYACEMFPGAREALIGFAEKPSKTTGLPAATIARAWIERWVSNRAAQSNILLRIRDSGSAIISAELRNRADRARLEEPRFAPSVDIEIGLPSRMNVAVGDAGED